MQNATQNRRLTGFPAAAVTWVFIVLTLVATAPQALAEDDPLTDVYKLPVWIDGLERVCPWKSSAGEGYIRVVRTDMNSHHGLYLQWVRKGIAGAPTQATSTVLVEELEKQYQVRLQMPSARLSSDACHLGMLGESITTERRYQFELVLKGPGNYTLNVTHLLEGGL
ncbi:hypothetical protein ACQUQU_04835 [Thalassolituus sp. LLYu03]|uniref:hypothetical protein n=1 Tax=Thalassolituus sp. LLYu03 TaxID=3421656 RepID=UPI003D2AB49D